LPKEKEGESVKANHKLALAVVVGVTIGVAGATAIHAQQEKVAPGYVIAEVDVTDLATMQKYGEKVPDTLAPFNHHYVVRGGKTDSLEGQPPNGHIVIIAFDSVAKAHEWYDSPAYQAVKPIRQSAAKSRIFIAEGVAP
jgi:uncharacterized protein (DUF1330 family)